jgi:hypothetical protein
MANYRLRGNRNPLFAWAVANAEGKLIAKAKLGAGITIEQVTPGGVRAVLTCRPRPR